MTVQRFIRPENAIDGGGRHGELPLDLKYPFLFYKILSSIVLTAVAVALPFCLLKFHIICDWGNARCCHYVKVLVFFILLHAYQPKAFFLLSTLPTLVCY